MRIERQSRLLLLGLLRLARGRRSSAARRAGYICGRRRRGSDPLVDAKRECTHETGEVFARRIAAERAGAGR